MGERRKVRVLKGKSYEQYLIDIIASGQKKRKYSRLLHDLYLIPFRYSLWLDESREADGLDMREAYLDTFGFAGQRDFPEKCTVLEVLVAMCLRCERDVMGRSDKDRTDEWFWEMMYHARLTDYPDNLYRQREVCNIINRILDRKYDKNGDGSFFYIPGDNRNWRKADLWMQMMWQMDKKLEDEGFYDF